MNEKWSDVMKKLALFLAAAVLAGYLVTTPSWTYDVMAEETVSGGDMLPGADDMGAGTAGSEKSGTAADMEEARLSLQEILKTRTVMALVYLSDEYPLRSEASYEGQTLVTVPSGQQVQIKDVFTDENGEVWEYVTLFYQEKEFNGYIPRNFLACSDEVFLEWEETYGTNPDALMFRYDGKGRSVPLDVQQFPESYQAALTSLKQSHPNWTFVKMNTGLDWNEVVRNQMVPGRSLIPSSFPAHMQNGLFSSGWAHATEDTLKYYLDPRSWLGESTIFQFEQLTYNESYHTEAAVQSFLNNTFMSGIIPNLQITYAKTFWATGRELGVSPFHLACRVYQEQGRGTSPLISGTYPGYEGYYNYFNIGASGTTDKQVIESGLTRARKENWNNGYASIYGGAKILASNYILQGQDTLYLQKFDVDASHNGLYWHQYMQNICAPSSEGKNIRKSYETAGSLDNTFVFKIPVYNNMPASPCTEPGASYSVAVAPPEGYGDTKIWLDGVEYTATALNGKLIINAPNGNARTAVMYKYNESGVPVGMYVWSLSHNGSAYTASPVPELQNLMSYHGFSVRIVGKSGIRFKTGIDANLRNQLTSGGAGGYTLKEYGTIIMTNSNRGQYPFVKGGDKVLGGMSYGLNESGSLEDKIYETVSGRYRFTSVLVGLPVNQYKTDFAFRGYAVLNQNGSDVVVYGPVVWRSIYTLAQQVLNSGQYEQGSSADQFLRKLISDADR